MGKAAVILQMLREGFSVVDIADVLYGDRSVRGRRRVYSILAKLRKRGQLPADVDPQQIERRIEAEFLREYERGIAALYENDEESFYEAYTALRKLSRKALKLGYHNIAIQSAKCAIKLLTHKRIVKKEKDLEELRRIAEEIQNKLKKDEYGVDLNIDGEVIPKKEK